MDAGRSKAAWGEVRSLMPGRAALGALFLSFVVSAAIILAGPAELAQWSLAPSLTRLAMIGALVALILWRPGLGHPLVRRMLVILVGIGFLIVAWDVIRVLNHSTMTLPFPLADRLLSSWDRALGFDWHGYFDLVARNALLRESMAWAYGSLTILSVVAYLLMCLHADLRRSVFFLEVFTLTAVVCTLAGAVFPARAAVDFYLGAGSDLSRFPAEPGLYHLAALERLRSGAPVELVLGEMPGLVTFPSFHTAAGVLLAVATWRTWMFVPACLYAAVMIASTPVYGGHYFVDLIAGTLVALLICGLWARRDAYRTLFFREAKVGPA